jgi:hypothetical protein
MRFISIAVACTRAGDSAGIPMRGASRPTPANPKPVLSHRTACWVALPLLSTIMLAGCASQPMRPMHWSKADTNQEQFMKERYVCLQEAQQGRSAGYVDRYGGSSVGTVVTNGPLFTSCMMARGYAQNTDGPLVAPPEAVVRTSQ